MNIQWYPGHMTKAKRAMKEDIRLIDLVVELVDAREPFSSRNPDIDELAAGKARMVLLNKADLADERENAAWAALFEAKKIHAVKIDARNKGTLYLQQKAGESRANPAMPMDTCVAMTQGSIGYWLQNAMMGELNHRGLKKNVISLVTQVEVDPQDAAFTHPTKPIGPFLTREQAESARAQDHAIYVEDSGRGWRKVVPSPKPLKILEASVVEQLLSPDNIVVCGGGGGIPVIRTGDGYEGVEAVVDKDLAAEKLAELVNADVLLILTGVDHVFVNFNKPDEMPLKTVNTAQLRNYIKEQQFPAGSMLPKIQAAMTFVESGENRRAVITSLENLDSFGEDRGTEIIAS